MTAPLTIYALRHGDVENPEKILYGRMEGFHLSETGRGQASAAARHLEDKTLSAIYSSPMERAQETANIIATAQDDFIDIQIDERINEVYTPYDGTPHSDLEKTYFDLYTGTGDEYEKPADVLERVLDFINDKRAQHSGEEIAMVSHGDIIVVLFLYVHGYTGSDIGRGKLYGMGLPEEYPATASVSKLVFKTDDPDEIPSFDYVKPYSSI